MWGSLEVGQTDHSVGAGFDANSRACRPVPKPRPATPASGSPWAADSHAASLTSAVLKVLEEENIPISVIAGTSVGALIGAAYCSGVVACGTGRKSRAVCASKPLLAGPSRATASPPTSA